MLPTRTAALAYSLKHLGGEGIDEYLQGLSQDKRAVAQEKLDELNESPEALERATVLGYAETAESEPATASTILTTRDFVDHMLFGWCNAPGDCTVFQTVTMEMSLEQTFYPEMNLFGDFSADSGTFQLQEFSCKMQRNNIPFPITTAYTFPNCTPMQFPSTYKQIFVGSWEHEAYLLQGYYMEYDGFIVPRPDIQATLGFTYHEQLHFIDATQSFAWND